MVSVLKESGDTTTLILVEDPLQVFPYIVLSNKINIHGMPCYEYINGCSLSLNFFSRIDS